MARSQACLHPCPEERLTCAQLLQLPYFSGIEASLPADFRSARVSTSLTPACTRTRCYSQSSHCLGQVCARHSTGNSHNELLCV